MDLILLRIWGYGLLYILGVIVATIMLAELIPKSLKRKYLRPPYYSEGEAVMYDAYPFKLQLAVQFTAFTAWPKIASRRNLSNAYLDAPRWWRGISLAYVYFALLPGAAWILLGVGVVLWFKLLK